MNEDKNLKEILMNFTVQETSAGFTNDIMKRVEATVTASQNVPVIKQKPLQKLMIAFGVICILLFALCIFIQPVKLPFHFNIILLLSYCMQVIYFLIVFWLVMLVNQLWNRKRFYA